MKVASFNKTIIDGYLRLLEHLNPQARLDLISRLTLSLKKDFKKNKPSFERSFSAWSGDGTAEEMDAEIRKSRNFNRQLEDL